MPELWLIIKIGIYAVMAIGLVSALSAVLLPNIFHTALSLIALLVSVAALFISLQADFLAAVQILLYVGAIMTLVIFAIMLTNRMNDPAFVSYNRLVFPAAVGSITLFAIMMRLILTTPWPVKSVNLKTYLTAVDLGKALMTKYVFPFEVISVLLIAVLVGAVVIARKEKTR